MISAIAAGISAVIAFGSLIYTVYSGSKATKSLAISEAAKETAEKAYRNSQGDSEFIVFQCIANSIKDLDDCSLNYQQAKERLNTDQMEPYNLILSSRIQSVLNTYDIACQRYLDGKLDKTRFEKTYKKRISDLFDNESCYKNFISDPSSTRYHALHKVHNELNNPEC